MSNDQWVYQYIKHSLLKGIHSVYQSVQSEHSAYSVSSRNTRLCSHEEDYRKELTTLDNWRYCTYDKEEGFST
jgi:hypothetical protein